MDTKAFGAVTVALKALDPEDPAGQFEAVLSAPTMDRDGEVIDAKAFEPLPDHITIDVDHGMSTSTTVGSGTPFYDQDLLKFRGTFSTLPRAQEVRTLVTEGHVRKMSVAFMNAVRSTDENGATHITSAELLNAAIVPIPSNREASILSAKSAETGAMNMAACPKCAAETLSTDTQDGKAAASAPATPDGDEAAAPAPADLHGTGAAMQAKAALAEAQKASVDVLSPTRS